MVVYDGRVGPEAVGFRWPVAPTRRSGVVVSGIWSFRCFGQPRVSRGQRKGGCTVQETVGIMVREMGTSEHLEGLGAGIPLRQCEKMASRFTGEW